MPDRPESPRQILARPGFQEILRRTDLHALLLKRVKAGLPAHLAGHCHYCVAQEDGGVLVYTDSQAFASQLRFLAPTLLAAINEGGGGFVAKRIAIRNLSGAEFPPVEKPMPPMPPPSPETIAMVKASSAVAAGDELARSLARLAAAMERYAQKNPP